MLRAPPRDTGAGGRRVSRRQPPAKPHDLSRRPGGPFRRDQARASRGRRVVGAYHSHPRSAAIPSPTDRREAHPDFVYVIVSLADPRTPDVRGYRLLGEELVEVPLVAAG